MGELSLCCHSVSRRFGTLSLRYQAVVAVELRLLKAGLDRSELRRKGDFQKKLIDR